MCLLRHLPHESLARQSTTLPRLCSTQSLGRRFASYFGSPFKAGQPDRPPLPFQRSPLSVFCNSINLASCRLRSSWHIKAPRGSGSRSACARRAEISPISLSMSFIILALYKRHGMRRVTAGCHHDYRPNKWVESIRYA